MSNKLYRMGLVYREEVQDGKKEFIIIDTDVAEAKGITRIY